jgi:hypothetical protein
MIATTTELSFAVSDSIVAKDSEVAKNLSRPRRLITPEVGRALERLGHAIEYLTDELVHEGNSKPGANHQLEAVQVMIALRRQVYLETPEVSPFGSRCRVFLKRLMA